MHFSRCGSSPSAQVPVDFMRQDQDSAKQQCSQFSADIGPRTPQDKGYVAVQECWEQTAHCRLQAMGYMESPKLAL